MALLPYLSEIKLFAFAFPPKGWALCQGQLLPISQYDVLFNLIGTTYGGDGQNTFALPNLASRIPYHQGSGYVLGQQGGAEDVTLTVSQIPQHSHTANVDENVGAVDIHLTPGDLQEIDRAAADIEVHGARYPEHLQKMVGR